MDEQQKNNDAIDLRYELEEAENQAFNLDDKDTSNASGITGLILKLSGGLVKDEKQAIYIMIASIVVMILISLFLLYGAFRPPPGPPAGETSDPAILEGVF